MKWTEKNLYNNWLIVNEENNIIDIKGNEKNAKLAAAAPELLEALKHTLEILYKCDAPKELMEEYGNAFMNYNELIKKATE